jgi:hypothetical protein
LIVRRILRIATWSALGRAWSQKSSKWLSLGGALILLRVIDRSAAKAGERAKSRKAA